ncbi:MAG: OmpA family protein [Myxococcales bacterium]|nr:OmpA family protein [Myxococcales bacterium]
MSNPPEQHRIYRPGVVACVALAVAMAMGCGPSEREVALGKRADRLQQQLADARQRADDLQVRVRTIRARNKVLIGLVQGLTADPQRAIAADERKQAPMGQATQALEELDRDLDVLASSLRRSRADFVELHTERKALQTNLDEAMDTIEQSRAREAQAQSRVDTFREMLMKLHAMIVASKLEVQVVRNRMVVKLPDSLLFETGRASLTKGGRTLLDEVADALKGAGGREFQVAGHTDNVPIRNWRFRSNWHLSAARAVTVTRYLVERGVPATHISAAGYADTRPVTDDNSEAGRRKNRRIEIVLLPNLDELPDLSVLEAMLREDEREHAEGTEQSHVHAPPDTQGAGAPPAAAAAPATDSGADSRPRSVVESDPGAASESDSGSAAESDSGSAAESDSGSDSGSGTGAGGHGHPDHLH